MQTPCTVCLFPHHVRLLSCCWPAYTRSPLTFLRDSVLPFFFFFNDTATTEIYTLSLHDALPIYGSAKPFVALLAFAGREQQSARRRMLSLPCPLRVGSAGRWIHIVPSDTLRISYTLDNDHPAIGTQVLSWSPSERSFVEEFAPARTYGFLRDLGLMRKNGLARGGSLDNAIVLGNSGALNGLRYRDEFVRHKILDLLGDLALLGRPVRAHVIARNGGHALNLELVLAVQRAVGLERRAAATVPATAADRAARDAARREDFVPAPGLVTI